MRDVEIVEASQEPPLQVQNAKCKVQSGLAAPRCPMGTLHFALCILHFALPDQPTQKFMVPRRGDSGGGP